MYGLKFTILSILKKLESFDLYLISNIEKSVGLMTINYLAKVEDYRSAGRLYLSGMVEMVTVVGGWQQNCWQDLVEVKEDRLLILLLVSH